MNDTLTSQVEGGLLPDGNLFLYAASTPAQYYDKAFLKRHLFAWDEASFYGTTIETAIVDGVEGVRLNPAQALALFTSPQSTRLITWEWSESLQSYPEMFALVQQALAEGQYTLDFEAWKVGQIAWKFPYTFPLNAELESLAEEWLDRVITYQLAENEDLKEAYAHVLEQHPVLSLPQSKRKEWIDEEEWREAIGLRPEGIPFRMGIRLSEPNDRTSGWRLEIALQSREQQEMKLFGTLEQLKHILPEDWKDYSSVMERTIRSWLRDEPWLEDPQRNTIKTQLNAEETYRMLSETILSFANKGVPIYLPSTWKSIRRERPRLRAVTRSPGIGQHASTGTFFHKNQLFSFDWKISIGDVELDEQQLHRLSQGEARMENISGQWIMLSNEMLREIRNTLELHESKQLSVLDILKLQLTMKEQGESSLEEETQWDESGAFTLVTERDLAEIREQPRAAKEFEVALEDGPLVELIQRLDQHDPQMQIDVPAEFRGELRPYQRAGVSWLLYLRQLGLGCCLADDMGLGKTIQFIVYLQYLKSQQALGQPALLICPTSVLGNWLKEFEKFAPNLKVMAHYGADRLRDEAFFEACNKADVVVTTYALGLLDHAQIQQVTWEALCLDEAQHIKNAYTKQASAVRKLTANHRIAMTGTPLENRLDDLWSIFQFLNPGYFGSSRQFREQYARPIEMENDQQKKEELRKRIRPFLLRREKSDPKIGLELPSKTESKTYVSLTLEQAELYQHAVNDMLDQIDRLSAFERKGWIVSKLARLKQICDHPALVLGEEETERIFEPNRSLKLERLIEMVTDLREVGDQCLIFTQYVGMGRIIKRILERELGEEVPFMYGAVPQKKREEMIEQFQAGERGVFVLSLKTGGAGLNLTAASHVFHYDRWWNPAVEEQATDRAYRIGQQKQVYVYKMVAIGTLEERIDEMLTRKKSLTTEMLDTSESWVTEMSTDELKQLLTLSSTPG